MSAAPALVREIPAVRCSACAFYARLWDNGPASGQGTCTRAGDAGNAPRVSALHFCESFVTQGDQGAALLSDVSAYIRRFVAMTPAQADAAALWAAHTWVEEPGDHAAYLLITSGSKGCGKSTLVDVIAQLVRNPLKADNATGAALFRAIEEHRPTLLLDELDQLLTGDRERAADLTGILNSGYRSDGSVLRCVGDNHKTRAFSTFGPKLLSGIGSALHPTTRDRCIPIVLTRAVDRPERARSRVVKEAAAPLKERLGAWVAALGRDLSRPLEYPVMPEELTDRQQDIWEPLAIIAAAAGDGWLARAHGAMRELHAAAAAEDDDPKVQVLLAAAAVVAAEVLEHVTPTDLRRKILERAPEAMEGRDGSPLSQKAFGRIMRAFNLAPAHAPGGRERRYDGQAIYRAAAPYRPRARGSEAARVTASTSLVATE